MLIPDRIKLIIKANNETPSSFADNIGVKRSNLSHILNGRNNPSLDFLSKVINAYPNVNASWLITGTTREGDFEEATNPTQNSASTDVGEQGIERIVVFYTNGTFKEYTASEQ